MARPLYRDVLNQPVNQQQIDETALGIVYKKSFPGYKMLNPVNYIGALMPDREHVYNMTGVRIIYDKLPDISLLLNTCPPKRKCLPCAPPPPPTPAAGSRPPGSGGTAAVRDAGPPGKGGTAAARDAGPPGRGSGGRPDDDCPEGSPATRKRCETASNVDKPSRPIPCPLYDRAAEKDRRRQQRRQQKEKERAENGDGCADNVKRDVPPSQGGGRRPTADVPDDKSKYDQFSPVGPAANLRNDGNASRRQPTRDEPSSNDSADDCSGSGSPSDGADDTSGASDSCNDSTVSRSNSSANESSLLTSDDNCSPPPAVRRPRAAANPKFRGANDGECR